MVGRPHQEILHMSGHDAIEELDVAQIPVGKDEVDALFEESLQRYWSTKRIKPKSTMQADS